MVGTDVTATEVPARGGAPGFVRCLGRFDVTLLVMGGIIGSGIFMNPSVVARSLHTPFLILAAWGVGGLIALAGAFIWAELAARRPQVGGQYAYLRESLHPILGFLYGWVVLLIIVGGGMAASAITFASYFVDLTGTPISEKVLATLTLAGLTVLNCLGVRAAGTAQNLFMLLKVLAILALIACGLLFARGAPPRAPAVVPLTDSPGPLGPIAAFGAAMVPVLFAYGGWQTASFVAGEVRDPRRTLPQGLVLGTLAVVALYLAVNAACLRALGPAGLAGTHTPASDVMRAALGEPGARFIAAGIALSTVGFLSQAMLTTPRVYFAMADDGVFFRGLARLDPRSRVPVGAIALQGALAILVALSGRYEQILGYVIATDWIFFGLSACCVFVLRRRDRGADPAGARVPGHPWTTAGFVLASALVVAATIAEYPVNSLIGLAIMLAGVPVYFVWGARASTRPG